MSATPASSSKHVSFIALRDPGGRAYLAGTALVMMADAIEHVISYWILFEKFNSPVLGGIAVITHWAPFLLLSVYTGALADRYDPRRIIQIGMVFFMLTSLGWALLFLTDTLTWWNATFLLILHGLAGVFWGPAAQLIIHDIAGTTQLQSAIRLLAMSRTIGLLLGPAVGGVMLLWLNPATGLFINIFIYVPLTWWLWKAPYGPKFRKHDPAHPPQRVPSRTFSDFAVTFRKIAGNNVIVSMTVLAGLASFFIGVAIQPLMPAFSAHLGVEAAKGAASVAAGDGHAHGAISASTRYSILLSANAAGAVAAGLVLELRGLLPPAPRTAVILVALWALSLMGFAATSSFVLAVTLLFAAGFLQLTHQAMTQALVQMNAPADLRGRVIGLYQTCSLGMMTFSGVTVGFGASLLGLHTALILSGAALFASVVVIVPLIMRAQPRPEVNW
ncbi:MAG: MFS transporter [Hyphomicrobiales bacterium]|nr:MFS transporter [Hyphomicrobiales bacterium]